MLSTEAILPAFNERTLRRLGIPQVDITLIPYGCTTFRIAEFPVVDEHQR